MSNTRVTFSEHELECLRFMAEHFDTKDKYVSVRTLPRFEEFGRPGMNEVLQRFSRYGLVKWMSNMSVEILPHLLDVVHQLDSPQQEVQQPRTHPLEITDSLKRFRADYPDAERAAFIMMQFGNTKHHEEIVDAVRNALSHYDINALRADDKEYHDDLFPNVLTYLHGCAFGIAVFERLEADDFNPNVSLEVGYMRALRKPVCLLKDQTLRTLQTDLVGKLYKSFDPQSPGSSIPGELEKWLRDKDIITL